MDTLLPPVFLLAYFVAFFAFAFVWRSLRVWRRTGVNPVVLPAGDDAYAYVGRAFKRVMVCCGVVAALIAVAIIAGAGALGTAIDDKFVYIQGKVAAAN